MEARGLHTADEHRMNLKDLLISATSCPGPFWMVLPLPGNGDGDCPKNVQHGTAQNSIPLTLNS